MKNKILSMMNTTKKKVGVAILCGAFAATIGSATALAASSKSSLMVKVQNGVKTFSTDGGKTWNTNVPSGVTIGEDGKISMGNVTMTKGGEGKGILCKVENGVKSYSTDGGKTWSEKAPAGIKDSVTMDESGKNIAINSNQSGDANKTRVMVKVKDGVKSYSLDGGKTWSAKAPDGFKDKDPMDQEGNLPAVDKAALAKDGNIKILNIKKENGNELSVLIKEENGVKSYSTDGGKTWSEKAPDGVTEIEAGMINS